MAKKTATNKPTTATPKKVAKSMTATATAKPARPAKKPASPVVDTPNFVSTTTESRNAFRQKIIKTEVTRDIRPVSPQTILDSVLPKYRAIAEEALQTGEMVVIQCKMDYQLIRELIMANGANRERTEDHCEGLATDFRGLDENGNDHPEAGFNAAMTHVVLSKGLIVQDGGHTTYAAGEAFFPLSIFDGIYWEEREIVDENGIKATRKVPKMPVVSSKFALNVDLDKEGNRADTPDNGKEKAAKWQAKIGEDNLIISLTINAKGDICRKLAERRLNIGVLQYLLMIPQLKEFMATEKLDGKTWEQIVKGWYLRTNCKVNKKGEITYGSMGIGGRPTNSQAPAWLLGFAPQIHDALLIRGKGLVHELVRKHLTLKDILIAMAILPVEGMQRLWYALDGTKGEASPLVEHLTPHLVNVDNAKHWQKKPSKWIVAVLIAFGEGMTAVDACDIPLVSPEDSPNFEQDVELRATGWDSGELDCVDDGNGEDRDRVLKDTGVVIAKITGDGEKIAIDLARKATRQGKGVKGRKA